MRTLPKDKYKFSQWDKTDKPLEAELLIKLKLRPAGWAGNDKGCLYIVEKLINLILQLNKFTNLLLGDEEMSFSARWKRPKQDWQQIELIED